MAIDNSKLKKVYDTLKGGGYEQDYDTFRRGFLGNDNYKNRKQVYDLLSQNGAEIGKSYEDFMQKMQSQPRQQRQSAAAPMTEEDRNRFIGSAGNIISSSKSDLARTKRIMDYADKKRELGVKPAQVGSVGDASVKLGENRNVVVEKKGEKTIYLDAEGNEFGNRAVADFSQSQIDEDREKREDILGYLDKKAMQGVNAAFEEKAAKAEEFKKEHPFLSAFSRALDAFGGRMSGGGSADVNQYTPEKANAGLAALALNQKTRQAIDEGKRFENGENGVIGRIGRGLKKGATEASTYDFGLSDAKTAVALKQAAERYESGHATPDDELLLDAAALNNEVMGKYSEGLGGWYGAGENLIGTVGFMAQIASNPASGIGKATAQKVSRAVARRAINKFGNGIARKAITGLAKGAARVAADAAEAGVVTGMYSPTKIVGDYADRKAGTVLRDGKGGYIFDGKETNDVKAIAKAINAQNAENLSEMWGDYLPGVGTLGKVLGKGARRIGAGKIVDAFQHMSTSQWAKTWNNFLERTKWNGMAGEYFEEVGNNLYNAITNGDMTLDANPNTGVFNKKINADTFKSVALMSGIMSGINTAGYARFKYKADKEQKQANHYASGILGTDKWAEIKDLIDNATDKTIGDVMERIGRDNNLNDVQKNAILNYQYKSTVAHGANIQDMKNKLEGGYDKSAEAYDAGYNAADDQLASIKDEYELQLSKIEGAYGEDTPVLQEIDEDPVGFVTKVRESGDEEHAEEVLDYINAKAAYDGMIHRVRDDIDDRIAESDAIISERENKEDGMLHPATMKLDDRQVYIVGGTVVMHDDGAGVNNASSSKTIVIRDANTGKLEFSSPEQVLSVDMPIDAEQQRQETAENIRQTFAQERANLIDGVVDFASGTVHQLISEDGGQHTYNILQDNGDGSVTVTVDNNTAQPLVMSKEQLQGMADLTRKSNMGQAQQQNVAEDSEREENAPSETEEKETTSSMPMTEDEEPDFAKVDPARAHQYLYSEAGLNRDEVGGFIKANLSQAQQALEKAKKNPPVIGTSIQKYRKEQEAYKAKVDEAQTAVDYWNAVKGEQDKIDAAEAHQRAEVQAEETRKAKEAEELRQQEELQKQTEQKERGANNVAPSIKEKWDSARKINGAENEIILPNGERVNGHYVLTESGAASPSHRATEEFAKTEGFPVDENGQSVNDRDYERDKDAQSVTRSIAHSYDSRALQTPVVVSKDGVVISGNGRTMAGELAAANDTDTSYIEHLAKYPHKFGFTTEQVTSMRHPRVVFVPDADMSYNAETFAKFNQQEMKGQSKTEQAVKLGKVVDDATFARITRAINGYDTLGDFYADNKATREAIKELQEAGVISHAQSAEMFDGEGVSAQGREILENMLVGKAFESNPDAVREITAFKSMRQSVITALAEIVNNKALGEEYSLEKELAEAIHLVYRARKDNHKAGERVSSYARQQNLFTFDEGNTVADYTNATMLMLADVLNDGRSTQLKKILTVYNQKAEDSAAGQLDMFSGGVLSKEEIWNNVKQLIDYGTETEQQQAIREATAQRKASVQQDEPVSGSNEENRKIEGVKLSNEFDEDGSPFIETSHGSTIFGEIKKESGLIPAPIKLSLGNSKYGLIHIEKRHGNQIRNAGFTSVEEFVEFVCKNYKQIKHGENSLGEDNGTYIIQIEDEHNNTLYIELSTDNQYWGVNSGGVFRKGYGKNKKEVWSASEVQNEQSATNSTLREEDKSDNPSTPNGNVPTTSFGKDSKLSDTKQENWQEKSQEGDDLFAKAERIAKEEEERHTRKEEEAKVDLNPTEKQKEAGNYKKGHIKVDGLDVTIEQPKGSIRRGKDADGKQWESEMHYTYGYIRGTEGVDGDHIDIFLSDNPAEGNVYVVDQVNEDGTFDEHKVMYGFTDVESAKKAYLSNYKKGWQGLGGITEVSKEDFKKWIDSSKRKTKPFASYSIVSNQNNNSKSLNERVDTERAATDKATLREQKKQELRNKLKMKLRGQLNVGIDPELFMVGAELAAMEIEDGVRKFADFAKKMISEIGDEIRPYLKALYNGARDMPGMEEVSEEMTPYEEVKAFNIASIGKNGEDAMPTLLDTAEQMDNEQMVERDIKQEQDNTTETGDVDNKTYSITKQYNKKKDIDIWVVRDKGERISREAYLKRKKEAKKNGNGYWSSFVNGFVFEKPEDAHAFADNTFGVNHNVSTPNTDVKNDQQHKESKTNDVGPTKIDFNSLHNALNTKGEAKLSDFTIKEEKPIVENHHGLKVGDKVLYKGKEATIFDFDNGKPVLNTGLAPVLYELVNYKDIAPLPGKVEVQQEEKGKTEKSEHKENNEQNKSVSLKQDKQLDLFGGTNTDNKPNEEENEKVNLRTGTSTPEREERQQPRQDEPLGEGTKHEDERADRGRVGGRSESHSMSGTTGSTRVSEQSKVSKRLNQDNNHAERGVDYAPKGVDGRIEANIKAIELMQQLIESGKKATPEQKAVLRQFSGWGGLGKAFKSKSYSWEQDGAAEKLRSLLGDEAFEQAEMSRNSAYYTPANVIDTMWDIVKALGFKGGNILEGSAGIGNILGLMPREVSENSHIHAVEIDQTTGNILSLLYPDAKTEIQGFEQTKIPNGSVDLAITNVPFVTGLRVNDTTGDGDLSKKFHDIHDFCIAKNIRKLKEGGIGVFISSNGTLDNSQRLRDWIVSNGNADVIGAFRMNNETFGGTGATSDIIVVRKRVNDKKSANAIDVSKAVGVRAGEFNKPGEKKATKVSMDYNGYFVEHPENMGGEMKFGYEEDNMYRPGSKSCYPVKGVDQRKRMENWAKTFSSMKEEEKASETAKEQENPVYEKLGSDVKEGSLFLNNDNELCVAHFGNAEPIEINGNKVKGHTKQECFKAYSEIKNALNEVLSYQTEHADDKELKKLQEKLNKAYDNFVDTYGHFTKNTAIAFLKNDLDYSSVAALETMKEDNDAEGNRRQTFTKSDVFSKRVVEKETEPHPTNVKEGVLISQYKNGRIDIPYIAQQLNRKEDEVREEIISSGLGFEDPASREVVVSYEYLSGNVREKLSQANAANEDGAYNNNIKALEKVVPAEIPAHLIEFSIGSSWVPDKLFSDYFKEKTGLDVRVVNVEGTWVIDEPYFTSTEPNRAMGVHSEKCDKTIYGHELIAAAMKNKTINVSKTIKDYDGSKQTITDKEATQACATKVDEIRDDFKEWAHGKMMEDENLSKEIEKIYNEKFNNYVFKSIPEDFYPKHFIGASSTITLRPHQAQAAIRATMENLMLAHEVGAGKTYTLISTAMEMRRLGTARKPMIVVQNATVGQFSASAKQLYPNAKILTLEEKDRSADGRKAFYAKIKYNDWDMIIIPQSTLNLIPDSEERQMAFVKDKIEEKLETLEKMRENDVDNGAIREAERNVAKLEEELAVLSEASSEKRKERDAKREAITKQNAAVKAQEMLSRVTDDVEDFEDMGIDALLVDEAHEYKHLGFATAMQRGVKGVDPSFSKKSQGVYLKCQSVMEKSGGKNVIFATGTPISNTAAEIWTFMRYLMPADTMKAYDIYYFDDFVRNFGNISQMGEFKTNGKFDEVNRFKGYTNLPELVRIWSSVSDTFLTEDAEGLKEKLPELAGGKAEDIYLPQTKALRSVMKFVKKQLDEFDKMSGKEKKDNSYIPLLMYGIAKAAAVDPRLVMNDAEDEPNSKTNEAVRRTLHALKQTESYKGTVAIFADVYQNKTSGFNLYKDIKDKLVAAGVQESQVAIANGMSQKKKQELFDKVNAGDVRVVLGSTFTLGTGVNIQERLNTIIHLDAPNRPMDYTQRNGRILRQGNLHKEMGKPIHILRFGVEDSLDVTAYQRLKTKGAIADSIMRGKGLMQDAMNNRVMEEEEDVFGDTVAQLSGSQYALLKQQAERELRKFVSRQRQWEADQIYIHKQKPKLEGQIKNAKDTIAEDKKYLSVLEKSNVSNTITVGKNTYNSIEEAGELLKAQNKAIKDETDFMRKSHGTAKQERKLSMNIGGFDFEVKTVLKKETEAKGVNLFTSIRRTMTYSCKALGIEDMPVKQGLLRNAIEDILENVLSGNDYRERVERMENFIERSEKELKQLSEREGKPFEFTKELEAAKKRVEEYTEKMKNELEEKEKKYAELDKSIEEATDLSEAIEDDEDVLYREENSGNIEEVNNKFNEELIGLNEKNAQSTRLSLGQPSYMLQSAGLPLKPIVLYGNKLFKKSKVHNFSLQDLRNLPLSLQNPIAVFKGSHKDSFAILLDIKLNGHHTLASIEVNKKGEADFNIVSSVFGKEYKGVIKWILDGKLLSVDKEKAQTYISASALNADATYKDELSSAANIIKDFHNPNINADILRESNENNSESTTSNSSHYTRAQQQAYALRQIRRAHEIARKTIDELHLNEKVNIIEDAGRVGLEGRRSKAKGWYDKSIDKITIVIGNHRSPQDVVTTILHEAVAHYGLRKLFGSHFDDFIYNVYAHGSEEVRREISNLALKKYGGRIDIATEEYLARLVENTDFGRAIQSGWWQQIKDWFLNMLHKVGFKGYNGSDLTDNELRYILWRSYENLKEPGRYRSIIDKAIDINRQNELNVGNFSKHEQEAMQKVAEEDVDETMEDNVNDAHGVLYREEERPIETARTIYEEAVKDTGSATMLGALMHTLTKDGRERFKHKFAEAYFDFSRSIKALQDAISKSLGKSIESYENVWISLNAKGSIDAQEITTATLRYIEPLAEHIGKMIKGKKMAGKTITLDDVEIYMNALHGIERNKKMSEQLLEDIVNKELVNLSKKREHVLEALGYDKQEIASIIEAERKGKYEEEVEKHAVETRKDYAGLTALFRDEFGEDEPIIEQLEAKAKEYTEAFEELIGKDNTDEMWEMVKSLNEFSLRKAYTSGLISREQYDNTRNMYEHYVPLRGWHDDYAGDVYQYISRGEGAHALQSVLKKAYGRTSRAGNILGTMAAMANSAIVQGNKNIVAQKLLNLALDKGQEAGLLMASKQWYEKNEKGELRPLSPTLSEKMTAEEMQEEIEDFERRMQEAKDSNNTRLYSGRFKSNFGMNMEKWQEQQHSVRVLRNGVEYQVYVLGNSKAAQAFNGLLTPENEVTKLGEWWRKWLRFKASMQTSLNPEFVISNFQRDIITAGTGTFVKFGWGAGVAFADNLRKTSPLTGIGKENIASLFYRMRKGTLDPDNEIDKMFAEFVRNGGITGVSGITRNEEYEAQMLKTVKRIKHANLSIPQKAWNGLAEGVEFANSCIENATRFAAYMTSRNMGKTVLESVFDAKECSVNFNMKGSGAWGNAWMRRNILYVNPALQALRMLGTWYGASPARFMGVATTILAASIGTALLFGVFMGGGDDNDWWKLNEFNRYNYINIYTGNGFAHWSIPQELRPMWALGQIAFDWQQGMITEDQAVNSMLTQLNNLSPMSFFSGGTNSDESIWKTFIQAWTPTIIADFLDPYLWNENFLGRKITNQSDWNRDAPEWKRAGKDTPLWAVQISKDWNELTGGRDNKKSWWDSPALNPSAVFYVLKQQVGGMGTLIQKISKAYEQWQDPDESVEARNIPFVSKFWIGVGDDYSKNRVVDHKFNMIWNEWKQTDYEIKHDRSDVRNGDMDFEDMQKDIEEMRADGSLKQYELLIGQMHAYDHFKKLANDGDKNAAEELVKIKKNVVDIVENELKRPVR